MDATKCSRRSAGLTRRYFRSGSTMSFASWPLRGKPSITSNSTGQRSAMPVAERLIRKGSDRLPQRSWTQISPAAARLASPRWLITSGGPAPPPGEIHYAAAQARRRGEDVILLSVGDPDFATPPDDRRGRGRCAAEWRHALRRCPGPARPAASGGRPAPAGDRTRGLGRERRHPRRGAECLFVTTLCLCERGTRCWYRSRWYVTYEAVIRASGRGARCRGRRRRGGSGLIRRRWPPVSRRAAAPSSSPNPVQPDRNRDDGGGAGGAGEGGARA